MTTTLPPLLAGRSALFLDFDGTLADIASHPDGVQVPRGLPALLDGWHRQLGGALAIVTGRAHADLLRWLPAARHWAGAFEHGAIRVGADGERRVVAPPADLEAVHAATQAFAARHPGLVLERKTCSLSLHYRLNPALGPACVEWLQRCLAGRPQLQLMTGKAVVEVRPAGVGKGEAILAFMNEPPFAGRRPCFAGDDRTDEDGFAAVLKLGGDAIKVGEGASCAPHRCGDPTALRAWLLGHLEQQA